MPTDASLLSRSLPGGAAASAFLFTFLDLNSGKAALSEMGNKKCGALQEASGGVRGDDFIMTLMMMTGGGSKASLVIYI